jgi:radical SAM protein with 4Fe4S-binding SPASM domain
LAVFGRLNPANRVDVYDKRTWASVLLVDTNGAVYSYGDRFDQSRSAGNIFEAPLGQLLQSPAFFATANEARMRMSTCERCEYFGRVCRGDPMGESQQEFVDRNDDGTLRCVVAYGLMQHLQRRLGENYVGRQRLAETLSILESMKAA